TTNFSVIRALSQGTKVSIIGENSGWYKVKVGSQEGWVSTSYISVPGTKSMQGRTASTYSTPPVVTPEDEEMNTKQNQQERVMGQLISEEALLKDKASEDSETLDDISSDKTIEIIGEEDDWFNVI